jgi:hypothetical protein
MMEFVGRAELGIVVEKDQGQYELAFAVLKVIIPFEPATHWV